MYEPVWRFPRSTDDCLRAIAESQDGARLIAGGTDLAARIAQGVERPPVLVDLGRVEGLETLEVGDDRAFLGATVTHGALVRSSAIAKRAGVLAMACRHVGSPQIRARGTIGGNLANASPAADGATALLALEASIRIRTTDGDERLVGAADFFRGPGRCALDSRDLLEAVEFELPPPGAKSVYVKAGQRNALAIAIASVAAVYYPKEGRISVALGSVAPTPVRADAAERLFEKHWRGPDRAEELLTAVGAEAVKASCCIDDVRATASYRRRLVAVLTERALREICTV